MAAERGRFSDFKVAVNSEEILSELKHKGFVLAKEQSSEGVTTIMDYLGKVIHSFDVKVKPGSKPLVTSSRALDFHTDHHRAKWIVLHCIEQTDAGGETILVDAAKIYKKLSCDDQENLSPIMLSVHKVFEDDKGSYPLVSKTNGGLRFYYSSWLVRDDSTEEQKAALKSFREAIENEPSVELKLTKGDAIIFDNHRILHGRREIRGNQNRLLKRFWIE